MPLTARIQCLRQQLLDTPTTIDLHRAAALTAADARHGALPSVLRSAHAFYQVVADMPLSIGSGEQIVGDISPTPNALLFSPDLSTRWIGAMLADADMSHPLCDTLSETDRATITSTYIPYWSTRNLEATLSANLAAADLASVTQDLPLFQLAPISQIAGTDMAPGFADWLFRWGVAGVRDQAATALQSVSLTRPEQVRKSFFYRAQLRVADGILLLAERYARHAEVFAKSEAQTERVAELLHLQKMLRRIPAQPPETFDEALQMIWLIQVALYLGSPSNQICVGRLDQVLWPFYERSVQSGQMTAAQCRELMCQFLII